MALNHKLQSNCISHLKLNKNCTCSIVCYSQGIEIFLLSSKWPDEDAFFRDYAASHKKLSEPGFISPSRLALNVAVGVVVAAAVAILVRY